MSTRQPQSKFERRFFSGPIEVRMDGTEQESRLIEGYALLFNTPYDIGEDRIEEIASGSLDGADMSDVVALFNHDVNIPLARNSSGTLTLSVDERGLKYAFNAPISPNGDNVLEAVKSRTVKQSSFGFECDEADYTIQEGKRHRRITKFKKIWDVSPVTFPASPETEADSRGMSPDEASNGAWDKLEMSMENEKITALRSAEVRVILASYPQQNTQI